ncbi:MAG: 3-isopropylmalate dehydratase small subunit [Methanomassiliicoccales archaeon]|nr:3-isopropylmalate dehydratase small subunit [Methanomassiliicoccales archaeon]
MIRGRAWLFGDHINTDLIIPGRYLDDYSPENLVKHVLEDADPSFAKQVAKGDIIVAGRNFGCGSSREQAPLALKLAGVSGVIAVSFARIFFRNAVNVGLPVIICPQAQALLRQGDEVEVDLERGLVRSVVTGKELRFERLPKFLVEVLDNGGLVPYVRERLREE